jgi:glycosyltransferase involved in cell wall biosynthesis
VALLRDQGQRIRLVVVGGSPGGEDDYEPDLRRHVLATRLDEHVVFTGATADPRPYLWASDAFVLPSVREGMPNSLLEAMSCGVPVVASRVGGLPDIVGDEEAGLLVPPADPHALAAALGRVLHDAGLRGRLAAAARRRAASFAAEAVVPTIEALYADAAGVRRAA